MEIHLSNLLLKQNGSKASIECSDTLVLQHLTESANKAAGVSGLGDETDTGGLERAKSDISEEFGKSRGSQVNSRAVIRGSFISKEVDRLLLEQFISSELECALKKVSCSGRSEASQESSSTLLGNNLSDTAYESFVVSNGIKLDPCLNTVKLG
jgi:hypothetical protein